MPKLLGLPSYKQRHNLWFSLFIPAAVFYKTNFLFMLVMPFCAVVLYLYAPADHENKPVVSKKQKRKLKIVAYMVLIAEYLISLSITQILFPTLLFFRPCLFAWVCSLLRIK